MFCKSLQHDTKNTQQGRRLLMRTSVTSTLVVSKQADDLLSAVAGNQTNIECWIMRPRECCQELMSLHCPHPFLAISPGPYIHISLNA